MSHYTSLWDIVLKGVPPEDVETGCGSDLEECDMRGCCSDSGLAQEEVQERLDEEAAVKEEEEEEERVAREAAAEATLRAKEGEAAEAARTAEQEEEEAARRKQEEPQPGRRRGSTVSFGQTTECVEKDRSYSSVSDVEEEQDEQEEESTDSDGEDEDDYDEILMPLGGPRPRSDTMKTQPWVLPTHSNTTLPGVYEVQQRDKFKELFFSYEDLKKKLVVYAEEEMRGDAENKKKYETVLLCALRLCCEDLKQVEGAAALLVIAPKTLRTGDCRCIGVEPVDEGLRNRELEGTTILQPDFTTFFKNFAAHHPGDRDAQGRPTDGAFVVSSRSGLLKGSAVKLKVSAGKFNLANAGTRHTAAGDTAEALRKHNQECCNCSLGSHMGAVFVRSESGTVSVFPAREHGCVWRTPLP